MLADIIEVFAVARNNPYFKQDAYSIGYKLQPLQQINRIFIMYSRNKKKIIMFFFLQIMLFFEKRKRKYAKSSCKIPKFHSFYDLDCYHLYLNVEHTHTRTKITLHRTYTIYKYYMRIHICNMGVSILDPTRRVNLTQPESDTIRR
jgi:hypothetical protein